MPTTITWLLPADPAPAPPSTAAATAAEAAAERGQLAFLGYGLLRPFRRDEKSDFASAGGRRLLGARLGQVLGTRADTVAAPGELPWRTDFGSRLHLLRHRNNSDALRDLARLMVLEAVGRWERYVRITAVEVLDGPTGDPVVDGAVAALAGPRGRMLALLALYRLVDQNGSVLAEGGAVVAL